MMRACAFCDQPFQGVPDSPWDTVLGGTNKFFIAPSKGSLVPGWLLVISRKHFICSGAMKGREFEDLRNCLAMAGDMVQRTFGSPTIFEHGPSRPGTPLGCGIDHQHVHVVPLAFSLKDAVSSLFPGTDWELLQDLAATRDLYTSGIDYGIVQEPDGNIWWCRPPKNVRQVFRRVIAHTLGVPDQFDYAAFPQVPNILRTLDYLRPVSS
jgi:ATP adenylyltransferase